MNSLTSRCEVRTQNILVCQSCKVSHQQLRGTAGIHTWPGIGHHKGYCQLLRAEIKSVCSQRFTWFIWVWDKKLELVLEKQHLQMSIRGASLCLIVWKTERGRAVTWTKWGICLAGSLDNEALVFQTWGVTDSSTPGYEIWVIAFHTTH